jgi:hypothetical protein
LAWLWSTGEFPLGGRFYRSCENSLCLRPAHLVWAVTRIMERRLCAEFDGYVRLSGVDVVVDDLPSGWQRTVRITGTPPAAEAPPVLPRTVRRQSEHSSRRLAETA